MISAVYGSEHDEDNPILASSSGGEPVVPTENVGEVIWKLRPWAVDVSSGVEASIGLKSDAKILDFVKAVRAADAKN